MYSLFLAARYIRKRIIVWLGILSIAVAVMVFVVVMAVLVGFGERLKDFVRRTTAHVEISRQFVGGLADWQTVAAIAQESEGEHMKGGMPYVLGPALLQSRDFRFHGFVKGIDWQKELQLGNVAPYVRIPFTMDEIIADSGLTRDAASSALQSLIERDLVREAREFSRRREEGRPVFMRLADNPDLSGDAQKKVFAAL